MFKFEISRFSPGWPNRFSKGRSIVFLTLCGAAMLALSMAALPALGQTQGNEIRQLEGYLQSCEQSLAKRRQQEAGQGPDSQVYLDKIDATKKRMDRYRDWYNKSPNPLLVVDDLIEAEHDYEDAKAALAAHLSRVRYQNKLTLPTEDMARQCDSLRTRLAAARAAAASPSGDPTRTDPLPNLPIQTGEGPASEPDRAALQQAIQDYHQRWYATWCHRLSSGCAIVPNGVRDELLQWTRKATKQRQIVRIRRLLDCYDGCVMADRKSEREVGECRNQCKRNIP